MELKSLMLNKILKMVRFVTRETSFGQHVSKLIFGVNILNLDFGVQVDSVEQPIKSNSVGSGHVSHRWTSSFDDHLDDSFVVFKNVQLRFTLRRMCVCGYIIHIRQMLNLSLSLFSWCLDLVFIDGIISCPAQVSLGLSTWSCSVV